MSGVDLIGAVSIITAGLAMGIGSIGPAIGEGIAVARALGAMAQQPDESSTITRTLFVVVMIILFANPFWDHVVQAAGGK
ncbi:MAG: F0F1 ATP synthase subunit C [Bacteroidota bacterium]